MPNQKVYQTQNAAVSSYDWFEFATKAGYTTFYPAVAQDSTSKKYFLTTRVVDGDYNIGYLQVNNTNTELNFDVTFLTTVIVSGEALINFSEIVLTTIQTHTKFTLYKVNSAGTETSIGTIDTNTLTAGGVTEYHRRLAKMTLTQTTILPNEKLRLELIYYSNGVGISSIYFDPASRQTFTETGSGATIGSDMVLQIPFKVDTAL